MIVKRLFVLIGLIIGLSVASAVMADPRDAVDRGQRLDMDALRDDVRTNRLQIPAHPLMAEPPRPAAPNTKTKSKSRTSGGNSR
jgi:hypothetical protein